MFTVLSNTRNSNLLLIGALAIVLITLLILAVAPAISVPQPAPVSGARLSEAGSDYYERHPDLRAAGAAASLVAHPETPGMACESPVDCR